MLADGTSGEIVDVDEDGGVVFNTDEPMADGRMSARMGKADFEAALVNVTDEDGSLYWERADGNEDGAQNAENVQNAEDAENAENGASATETGAEEAAAQTQTDGAAPAQADETAAGQAEAMPMTADKKGREVPDYRAAAPERTHRYVYTESGLSREEADAFVEAKRKEAEAKMQGKSLRKPKMGTDIGRYKEEKARYEAAKKAAAEEKAYWDAVKAEQDKVLLAEREEQRRKMEAEIEASREKEQKRREEEERKKEERRKLGANAASQRIRKKWDAARKKWGKKHEIILADGTVLKGRYVLVESGAATASHDAQNGFASTEGYPVDENGQNLNDRDYQRDKEAQEHTRRIAGKYDGRALQEPVVATHDGVVLSGNGRTMAGELAARDGSDGAYTDFLNRHAEDYGFTAEDVAGYEHPRVLFVPDEAMEYTTETMAKFNKNGMKSQSKTETAVKMGKLIDDALFGRIASVIGGYDTLGAFYADDNATRNVIGELVTAGVVSETDIASLFDGGSLSQSGQELIESLLVGKLFAANPDAVRQLTEVRNLRQSVSYAIQAIVHNIGLGGGFSLADELARAVRLAYLARKNGFKAGDRVSGFARQGNLFEYDDGATVEDFGNAAVMMLADALNDSRVSLLKTVIVQYNSLAADAAAGVADMFSGGTRTKEEIVGFINEYLSGERGKAEKEQSDGRKQDGSAGGESKGNADAESGSAGGSHDESQPDGQGDAARQFEGVGEKERGQDSSLTEDGAVALIARMEADAAEMPQTELTPESWALAFDEDNSIETPLGRVKMGDNQIAKFLAKNRAGEFGMVAPTLSDPDVIIEEKSEAKDGSAERGSSFLFVKTFVRNGERVKFYASITVRKDGLEVSVSSHFVNKNALAKKMQGGRIMHIREALLPNSSEWHLAEHRDGVPDLLPTQGNNASSADKVDDNQPTLQGNDGKSSENKGVPPLSEKIEAASAEVNTEPSEAQKKAGNYKKGHVQVGTFDITIEQPQGSVRRGTDADGKAWESKMHNTYGYFRGTEGVDGDHIDVFLSNDIDSWDGKQVFVVDQYNPDGTFDEHKVMLGFNDMGEAKSDYLANYEKGWEDGRRIVVSATNLEDFEKWMDSSHRKTKPFAEYAGVRKETVANTPAKENAAKAESAANEKAESAKGETPKAGTEEKSGTEAKAGKNPSGNRIVTDERYEELKKRMRAKLRGQLNVGVDPEILAIGLEMAAYHIEKGARAFSEYAKAMIADLGDAVRPYIKAFYNGARDMPEMAEYAGEMTPYEEVRAFDTANFDKPRKDVFAQAEMVAAEHKAERDAGKAKAEREKKAGKAKADSQGNPINADGTLKLEKIASVDELTDEDFSAPTRNVELPELPKNVNDAIGADGKPVVIKKNIFEKNWNAHKFPSGESRAILKAALYDTDLVGQTQPTKRPLHWVAIKIDDKSPLVVLEVNENKDNVEIVGWYTLDGRNLERIKRQAEKNGGELVMLSPKDKVESLSTPLDGLSSKGKVKDSQPTLQGNDDKSSVQERNAETDAAAEEEIAKKLDEDPELEALRDKLGDIEEMWEKRIEDYLAEHYPNGFDGTRSRTAEQQALHDAERKAAREDAVLKKMREQADAEFDAADAELSAATERREGFYRKEAAGKSAEKETAAESGAGIAPESEESKGSKENKPSPAGKGEAETAGKKRAAKKPKGKVGADEEISDAGEKIGGARKDKFAEMAERAAKAQGESDETLSAFIAKTPLSKIFGFDLAKMREGGAGNAAVSFIAAAKGLVPAKPRTGWKLRRWVGNVLSLYRACLSAFADGGSVEKLLAECGDELKRRYDAYMAVGGYDGGLNTGTAGLQQFAKDSGAGMYGKDGEWISHDGWWYVSHAGKYTDVYRTREEAVAALRAFAGESVSAADGKRKEIKFSVYHNLKSGVYFITPSGKSGVVVQSGFESAEDAFKYVRDHNAELQELYRGMMDSTKVKLGENRERKGRDWRAGRDVGAEEFLRAFGFRGVEFGNWMKQEDRRKALNECYDALMDLADVCGVSPLALSLGGRLGMAFGARGGGNANAHYEPGKEVINLTKTKGAGSLAHEWFHAVDNYFAKSGGAEGFATSNDGISPRARAVSRGGRPAYWSDAERRFLSEEEYKEILAKHSVRAEMAAAWRHMSETMQSSGYGKRSSAYAELHSSSYWKQPTEMGARAFSVWVENQLSRRDATNDYLANNPKLFEEALSESDKRFSPYPFDTDAAWMDEAFGNLFGVMEEKVDEETGKHVLYQKSEGAAPVSREERVLRDALDERLREGGMEVIDDAAEGQRVLDRANGNGARKMSFGEPYDYGRYPLGRVEPGLANKEVSVVEADANHGFSNYKEAKVWAKENVSGTYGNEETGGKGEVRISNGAVDKFLSESAVGKSESKDVHLAVLKVLPEVLKASIDVETHPDFLKGESGKRSAENGMNKGVLVHRCYGAVSIDGKPYRVKITLKEDARNTDLPHNAHSYEATKIELLEGTLVKPEDDNPNTSNSITGAKLLGNVGMSYNPSEKVLDASRKRGAETRQQKDSGGKKPDAKTTGRVRYFRTADGEAYGFTADGKIYYDPRIATSETLVHEYAHLWASALRAGNAKEWRNVVALMKGTGVWEEVKRLYPELKTDDEIADEVLAHYSGRRGAERLRAEAERIAAGEGGVLGKADALSALEGVKRALEKFWKGVCDMLHIHYTSAEEVADRVMKDLLDGVDPRKFGREDGLRYQFAGERGAAAADRAEEVTTRLDNLNVARGMETAGKDAKAVKMATGWERGADGEWRYEMPDIEYVPTGDADLHHRIMMQPWGKELEELSDKIFDGETLTEAEAERFEELAAKSDEITKFYKELDRNHLADHVRADELFKAYPKLRAVNVEFVNRGASEGGWYSEKENTIYVNYNSLVSSEEVLAHEIQHAIQHIEGFARGGNPDMQLYAKNWKQKSKRLWTKYDKINSEIHKLHLDENGVYQYWLPMEVQEKVDELEEEAEKIRRKALNLEYPGNIGYKKYVRIAGEVEARNVQKRRRMTDEERKASLAAETEDVARKDQIFLFGDGGEMASATGVAADESAEEEAEKFRDGEAERAAEAGEEVQRAKADRVNGLSGRLNTPVRIISTEEEMAGLPGERQRRAKGWFDTRTGEVTIVLPNNADAADAENTFLHEVVGHDGLRLLFPEKGQLDGALDELYRRSGAGIRSRIDAETEKMFAEEVARIMERKRREHETRGENARASYYTDLADAHLEAGKKREQMRRTATEEYAADLAGSIGFEGFEKMGVEERSFWGRLKAVLRNALRRLSAALGIKSGREWTDKEWAYMLHEAYKRKKNGGRPGVFDLADTVAMRENTGFGETRGEEGIDKVNSRFNEQLSQFTPETADRINFDLGMPSGKLLSAGVANKPIRLHGSKVAKKMKKHGFSLDELRDLPRAVANPIAVFDNYGKDGNRSILTELRTANGNFLVTIDLGKGTEADFGIVSSVFGKQGRSVAAWINNGYLRYVDKEKALDYLHLSAPIAEASDNAELSSAAKVVENFENPKERDEKNADGGDIMFRDGNGVEYRKALARDVYERRVGRGMYQMREALQDSMLGLREAMDAVLDAEGSGKTHVEDIAGYENAYLGENRLSSVNQAECAEFARTLFEPLLESVAALAKTADERAELTDYMMAKHGLERNVVMARRAAARQTEREFGREIRAAELAFSENPLDMGVRAALEDLREKRAKREAELYDALRRDYSGLTALTEMEKLEEAEEEARRIVAAYEAAHRGETARLWARVNAVTRATLAKSYDCGLIGKAQFDDISGMYRYYIPLRGFDEKTDAEAYAHIGNPRGAFSSPIKTARGRKSKADDPLANMEAMMESAIMMGNRNALVKQRFLNFALGHPSDLVSVSGLWLRYDEAADEWFPAFPGDVAGTERIEEGDSPAVVERKTRDFEDAMKQLARSYPDRFARQSERPELYYRAVDDKDLQQHQVTVKRGGKTIVLTINGNPRAAQALNGLTNPDNDVSGAIGKVFAAGEAAALTEQSSAAMI